MTNGNSPKIASEIIDAILAYGDARADKDLVKGTASLKKSIELIRSANLAEPIAPRADADTAGASDLESLLADITAIDTWHRGAPSYEHDAGWFKDRVVRLLEERIADTPASSVAASERADAAPNPSDPDAVLRAYRQGVEDATRADAEKDAARLDWLEQEDEMGFFFNIDHISANINEGFNGFKTLREAIDAAILAANKEPQ